MDRSPWFVDVSGGAPSAAIPAYVDTARPPQQLTIVNLQVTADCAHGARVTETGRELLQISTEVRSGDHRTAVALIQATRTGRTSVLVTRPGHPTVRVPFVVTAADSRKP